MQNQFAPPSPTQSPERRVAAAPHPPWEETACETPASVSGSVDSRKDEDMLQLGGIGSWDQGEFASQFAAARRNAPITEAQIAAVLDVIMQAGCTDHQQAYLDPMAPPHERMLAFSHILRPAIERGEIPDISLSDDATLQQLYDETLSWGAAARQVMDDPDVTEIKFIGTGILADSSRGRIVMPNVYPAITAPESRIEALAQTAGILWDGEHPSITIPLPHKTRMHAIRAPMLRYGDLLGVVRRGRQTPWNLTDLVKHGTLSEEAATLLHALIQAFPSIIVSGAQDAGKTTFLECVLNSLPPDLFLALIEDNTDELQLATWLVSRLQVGSDISLYRKAVRGVLRITPDYMVPCEIRGSEAGPVIEIAYAGRPTITTIHADTPHDALERAALLAAAEDGESIFKAHPEWALRTISRTFHLVVHLEFSRRFYRRLVTSVYLLDGLNSDMSPRLIPLIEVVFPTVAGEEPQWVCHAQWHEGQLVWRDGCSETPARLARRLADVPSGGIRGIVRTTAATEQIEVLLADIRTALRHPDQGAYIISRIEQAHRLNPNLPEIWQIAERAWGSHSGVKAVLAPRIEQVLLALQTALATRDLGAAQSALDVAHESALLQTALRTDQRWQTAVAASTTLSQHVQELDDTLNAAHYFGMQQQDYTRAFRLLERFDAMMLPVTQAKELWEARIYLLRKQLEASGTTPSVTMIAQIQAAEQARAELNAGSLQVRSALAPSLDYSHTVAVLQDDQCLPPADSSSPALTAVPPKPTPEPAGAADIDNDSDDLAVLLNDTIECGEPDTCLLLASQNSSNDAQSLDAAEPIEPRTDNLLSAEDGELPIDLSSSVDVGNGLEGILERSVWDQWSTVRNRGTGQ